MKACSPPSSAISSSPGRKWRWYVLPSRMSAPSARTSSGCSVFTEAFVPTGMNAGVGTSPCAVWRTAARAAPSVAVTRNVMSWGQAPGPGSSDQHRIAEGVEAVALGDREVVQSPRLLDPRERHHESQERRPRQVEVRQQRVDPAELETGRDEEVAAARERRASHQRLEHAYRRRPDCQHPL